jgi:hypothetical protein
MNAARLREMREMVHQQWGPRAAYWVEMQAGLAHLVTQWTDKTTDAQWHEALEIVATFEGMDPTSRAMRRSVQWALHRVLAWIHHRDASAAARAKMVERRLPDAGFALPPAVLAQIDAMRNNRGAHGDGAETASGRHSG